MTDAGPCRGHTVCVYLPPDMHPVVEQEQEQD